MRRLARILVALAAIFATTVSAIARPAAPTLDQMVDRAARDFDVPGAMVVVVKGDKIIYQRAFGVLKLGAPDRIGIHTPFAIGSITKSFTAAAIARLVDDGRLGWDDKVVARLPEFRLHDDYVTAEITIRDILSHRTGLPSGAGDLLGWPETTIDTSARLAALRYLPLSRGFRARYGYSNLMYMAAGEIVARSTGMPWPAYIRSQFFGPLGMQDALLGNGDGDMNRVAWPHARIAGDVRGLGPVAPLSRRYSLTGDGAAGAIMASGADMAKWMSVQLADGVLPNGKRLFSAGAAREMHSLQTPLRIRPSEGVFAAADPSFSGYGFGWFVRDYGGAKVIYHAGGTLGAVAQVTLLPKEGIGIALLTNSEETGFLRAVELMFLDRYLQRPYFDWIAPEKAEEARDATTALAALRDARSKMPDGAPSLPTAAYAGRYRDDWFGSVTVTAIGEKMRISFDRSPYLQGKLEPVGGDVFRTHFDEPGMEEAYVTFRIENGKVTGASVAAISPLADFSFDYKDLHLVREAL